ncbi:MAG: AraC family transcriptional regulator [Rhizobiaceae bacterium]
MKVARKYPIAKPIRQACAMFDLSEARVLRRAGLSRDFLEFDHKIDAAEFFRVWVAIEQEAALPDLPVRAGRLAVHGPFVPALFAFACSPNIEIGVTRLATFKPLIAPVKLNSKVKGDVFAMSFASAEPDLPMPASMAVFEIAHFVESARTFTGVPIVPRMIGLPDPSGACAELTDFVGVAPRKCVLPTIEFALEDARRPLITEDTAFWNVIEKELTGRLASVQAEPKLSARVRATLLENLASGLANVDSVAERLRMSRRSLQRRLSEEGLTFQTVLDKARADLALTYLRRGDLSAEEISYLLAYRDPNSFYRAFYSWTGMTPAEARATA